MSSFIAEDKKDQTEAWLLDNDDLSEIMDDNVNRENDGEYFITESPVSNSGISSSMIHPASIRPVPHTIHEVLESTKDMVSRELRPVEEPNLFTGDPFGVRAMLKFLGPSDDAEIPAASSDDDVYTPVIIYNHTNHVVGDNTFKSRCKRACRPGNFRRRYCWVDRKTRRNHCFPILTITILLFVASIIMISYGIAKYYPQLNRVHTTCIVTTYFPIPISCSDGLNGVGNITTYVIFDYTISLIGFNYGNQSANNMTLESERSEEVKICSYDWDVGIKVAEKIYPIGTTFDAWYSLDNYSDLIFQNPQFAVNVMAAGFIAFNICIIVGVIHVIAVRRYNFKSVFKRCQ